MQTQVTITTRTLQWNSGTKTLGAAPVLEELLVVVLVDPDAPEPVEPPEAAAPVSRPSSGIAPVPVAVPTAFATVEGE